MTTSKNDNEKLIKLTIQQKELMESLNLLEKIRAEFEGIKSSPDSANLDEFLDKLRRLNAEQEKIGIDGAD